MEGVYTSLDLFNDKKETVFFFEEIIGSVEDRGHGTCLAEPVNQKALPFCSRALAIQYLMNVRNKQFKKQPVTAASLKQPTLF